MLRRIRHKRGEESLTESRDPERDTYPPSRRQLLTTHREDDPSDADAETLDFRLDAQAWHLYLVEAEREAKERAELWRTGLDSVLIFAALFAGIDSAFVIDVRKDLEADSEQRMLVNIERLLRGQSPADRHIRASSVAMSGLWNMSLYITLFSAMMGVSAKAWLATYVPITTVHDAREAFLRYKIDQHSERWRLREVISGVPLLVQFALFLFLIGLVIQNFNDYVALGFILLTCCALGGILYVLMTIHPWTTPSSPYNTPVSDPLMRLFKGLPSRGKAPPPPPVETDINKGLAQILYKRLIKSPKATYVDEAIAELALPSTKPHSMDYFCKTDTARVVLARVQAYASMKTVDADVRDSNIRNHILVFLRFLEQYEVGNTQEYRVLSEVLDELSSSDQNENPFSSVKSLPDDMGPLLFSLQLHLHARDVPKRIDSPIGNPTLTLPGWADSLSLEQISGPAQLHFKVAASRVIHQKEEDSWKTFCVKAIRFYLERSMSSMLSDEGPYLAHAETNIGASDQEALRCLLKLCQTSISEWRRIPIDVLHDWHPGVKFDLGAQAHSSTLQYLIWNLKAKGTNLAHPMRMLLHQQARDKGVLSALSAYLQEPGNERVLEDIAKEAVFNEKGARNDAIALLTTVSQNDDATKDFLLGALEKSLPRLFSGVGYPGSDPWIEIVRFKDAISQLPESPFSPSASKLNITLQGFRFTDYPPKELGTGVEIQQQPYLLQSIAESRALPHTLEYVHNYLRSTKVETKLTLDILDAVVRKLEVKGHLGGEELKLCSIMTLTDETVQHFAEKRLQPMLTNLRTERFRNQSPLRLLRALYSGRHRTLAYHTNGCFVDDVVNLLCDKLNKSDLLDMPEEAVELLPLLLEALMEGTDIEGRSGPPSAGVQYIASSLNFVLGRLEDLSKEGLNPKTNLALLRILSLISMDPETRERIVVQILRRLSQASHTNAQDASTSGHLMVLERLIYDRRFENETTDYIMIILAGHYMRFLNIYNRPEKKFGATILTGLWCMYGQKEYIPDGGKHKILADWFKAAVLGPNASALEVENWAARCRLWIAEAEAKDVRRVTSSTTLSSHFHDQHAGEISIDR